MTTSTAVPVRQDAPRPARTAPAPPRRPALGWLRSGSKHVLLIALALVMLYPLLWMVVSSFRPNDLIFREAGLIPSELDLSHYRSGWDAFRYPFSRFMVNTLVIAVGAVVGNVISSSLAAYAFARMRFRGRGPMFAITLLTVMLPIHVVIVPQYVIFSRLDLVNTFVPLILPKFLATDAFFVFLMVQFIRGIPRELDEAARIDGAGHLRIFTRIMVPLMLPAIATTAIFTFIGSWNDFFSQLIYLTSPENYTVSLALRGFIDAQAASNFGGMFAMSVVTVAPLFLIFLFGQRYLVKGIATTGLK
ncbi:carbohydrate ABC transporter permease [Cellulomonas hominis]